MKRSLIIIIGIIVVLALIAVWVYVLFFKTTPPPNTFSNLNLGDTTDTSINIETNDILGEPTINVTGQEKLRQLTTSPVAGFQEVSLEDTEGTQLYYIESGTGHIYHVNLMTGEQKRISGTTIPSTQKGEITIDGNFAFIQSGFGSSKQLIAGSISSTSEEIYTDFIEGDVIDFKSTVNNTLLYLVKEGSVLVGKEYFPTTKTNSDLFTIPFTEASISWGSSAGGAHYIFPKPTSKLEGYIYTIHNKELRRLPLSGFGASAVGNGPYIIQSGQINGEYVTHLYNNIDRSYVKSTLVTIPEKCTPLRITIDFICASENVTFNETTPDSWYKGDKTYSDLLWLISPISGNTTLLIDTRAEAGREIDIINPKAGFTETNIYFQNKNDQTLWLYGLVQ